MSRGGKQDNGPSAYLLWLHEQDLNAIVRRPVVYPVYFIIYALPEIRQVGVLT